MTYVKRYIIKRLLQAIPLLFLITIIVFCMMHFAPYDAVDSMTTPQMSAQTVQLIKAKYGYDKPLVVQYALWLKGIATGNFGYSIVTHQSIAVDLAARIPATIQLVLPAYLAALLLSVFLGLSAGAHKGKWSDKLIDGFCSLGIATPPFWFAMLLIFFLGFRLNLLPVLGMHTIGMENSAADYAAHYVMPFIVMVLAFVPDLTRYVRSSTIGQLSEDYVMVQKAFGASRFEILSRHVAKNVLLPIITKSGMMLPMLVTGSIIIESVFSWPGVGPYFIKAIQGMDYPIVMAILILSSTLVIVGNLLSDILYCLTDPRIREMG